MNGRVLGVQAHRSQEVESQVDSVVQEAFHMLALIAKGIRFKDWNIMMHLLRSLVRPHLEYCVQFLLPSIRKYAV